MSNMELWIRNQERTNLIKANDIFVYNQVIYVFKEENRVLVAEYKSKERALEVLDEIQELIKPKIVLTKMGEIIGETSVGTVYSTPNEYDIKELSTILYEMPKE